MSFLVFTYANMRLRCRYLLLFHFFLIAYCDPSDSSFLIKFKESLLQNGEESSILGSWNVSTSPCLGRRANWIGLLCNIEGRVWGIRLENMSLNGIIDVASIQNLTHLRTLSFMKNNFRGPLPDFSQLGALKSLYLSDNRFSGSIQSSMFLRMNSLKKIHLSRNRLEGPIPLSLPLLPKLIDLRLDSNRFEGPLPNFSPRNWISFNLSDNDLRGRIPPGLAILDASSFLGNEGLCGQPLKQCSPHDSSLLSMIVVGVVVFMALSAIVSMVVILCRCSTRPHSSSVEESTADGNDATNPSSSSPSHGGSGKLSFVRDDRERFEMQDLLGASAEMLGSGSLGSSYKASLGSGAVVVKRFKQMNNLGREEFHEHMRRIGGLRHPNVLPLVAFYFNRDEKLFVSDFVQTTSLAFHLHGREVRSESYERSRRAVLDGRRRFNIVKGVASGLKYLHDELPNVMAAHGHLKASNVLLKEYSYEAVVSDYGLIPLINQEHAQQQMTAYKSPEYSRHGRITKKTDVWSLGMLILEILTAKRASDDGEELVEWAISGRDNEEDEVFDKELLRTERRAKETMLMMKKLLRIGIECCEADVEKRLDIKEALHKIENVTTFTRNSDVDTFRSTEIAIV